MYTTIKKCRSCDSNNIKSFFHLGIQPLANSLPKNGDEIADERFYPLSLSYCFDCSLVQLNETVDPKELFTNYVWVTGTSDTAKEYAPKFADELIKRTNNAEKGYVLELASNDGVFLQPFKNKGYDVLGVDPAKNIAELAEKSGISTIVDFWSLGCAEKTVKENGKASMVFARNVVPHVANLVSFVNGISYALSDNGVAAIEVHYAKTILEDVHYDSIYHEHVHYFTLKTLQALLERSGLYVFDVGWSPINAVGLIVYASKSRRDISEMTKATLDRELIDCTNDFSSWEGFARASFEHRKEFISLLNEYKNKGFVVGWGASARSSTMLNFCNVGTKEIRVIADMNTMKHKRFTAGTHIPIDRPDVVMAKKPSCVVLLGWNFADEIKAMTKNEFAYEGDYIIPLPKRPRVETGLKTVNVVNDGKRFEHIDGVKVLQLKRISDERGTIMHGVRSDTILNLFGEVYFKKIYQGVVNGFHVHETLMLNYICIEGMIKLVLYDLREHSSTKGMLEEIFFGEHNYVLVHIPPGVANGMKAMTAPYSIVCNVASEPHDPGLKYRRIDPHSGEVPYVWSRKDF